MTERPDTAALREQLRDVLNMAWAALVALYDGEDAVDLSDMIDAQRGRFEAAARRALAARCDAPTPEGTAETTCPEGTCDGCPDPDACAALRPAPIPATEERREDATVKLPWVVHDAVEEDWYCFATEAEAVKKAQAIIDFYGGDSWPGAIDEITVMQVTHAPVETVLFEREGMTDDEWYEATEDDGDHDMWVNYSVRPVASPSAGTVQPDPEGLVVLRRSDVEALCEEWADLDEDPFWRPQPLPELLTLARDAVEACARNIAETGEWGIDALNKARAALAALGSSEGEDER